MKLQTLSEQEIVVTFAAIAMLLASAYICGKLMEMIRAPKVVGEILGGILLGGSFLHHFAPEFVESIFMAYPEEGQVLNLFYQMGLIFLMFSSGFNTCIEVGRKNLNIISAVFIGATFFPMLGALPFLPMFESHFIGENGNHISFALVFCISVAITSIPVISKIFFDIGIMNTTFSNTVLTVSTFQDLCLWVLLNMATLIATTGEVDFLHMAAVVVLTIGIFVVVKLITDRLKHGYSKEIKATDFYTISFVLLLVVCAILHGFGINIMYSAFLVGYVVKALFQGQPQTEQRMQAVADFAFSFFVPVYFALVGIQLNLLNDFSVPRFAVFFVIAFALEAVGTVAALLFTNLRKQVIVNFAVTMNARGGPGIVLATVAYSYRIINLEFFTVLILLTMLSSLIAGYWLRYQQKLDDTVFDVLTK